MRKGPVLSFKFVGSRSAPIKLQYVRKRIHNGKRTFLLVILPGSMRKARSTTNGKKNEVHSNYIKIGKQKKREAFS